MAEHTILLCKKTGGSGLTGPDGKTYLWAKGGDSDPVDTPYDWAVELLASPDREFYVHNEPHSKGTDSDGKEVTSPAPEAPARGAAALKSKDASPTTARPRGGTVKRS